MPESYRSPSYAERSRTDLASSWQFRTASPYHITPDDRTILDNSERPASLDFRPYAVACRVSVQEEAGFRATGVGHGGSEK